MNQTSDKHELIFFMFSTYISTTKHEYNIYFRTTPRNAMAVVSTDLKDPST